MNAHYLACANFQWTVQPLVDNFDEDEFEYLIHVHTGFKLSAGSKSRVSFRVSGTESETGVRRMDDGLRQVCPASAVTLLPQAQSRRH